MPFKNITVRRISVIVLSLVAFLVFTTCDLFKGPDIRAKAANDVAVASASDRHITIDNVSSGSTAPAGTVQAKDGFAVEIEGTAQPEYVLIGWKQSGGSGTASFTALSTTRVSVVATGGDVSITPVYEARPVVLYSTPIGNNIAKNSSVRVVFNREVDSTQLSYTNVNVMKQAITNVPYTISAKPGSKVVSFKPSSLSLDDYQQYIVTVKAGIPAKITFDSTNYPGVTFLNTSVVTRTDYINPFVTGATFDSVPPTNASFKLSNTLTPANQSYTNSQAVLLSQISAVDDSGDGGVASYFVKNGPDPAYPLIGTDYVDNGSSPWILSGNTEGQYIVSMIFEDVNNNLMATTSAVSNTIYLDKTAPVVSNFSINGSTNAPTFTSVLNPTLSISAQDPVISGLTVPGSGESANGIDPSEQKTMQLSNTGVFVAPVPFQTAPTWNLASGSDGSRTVYLKVLDGAGNSTTTKTATISVDTTAPSVTSILLGNGTLYKKSNQNITLKIIATDNVVPAVTGSGLYGLALNAATTGLNPGSAYSANRNGGTVASGSLTGQTFGGTIPYADSVDLVISAGDGTKHIVLDVTDGVGHTTTVPVDVIYDNIAPDATAATLLVNGSPGVPPTTSNTQVSLTQISATDNVSGVTDMAIETVEAPTPTSTPTPDINLATWMPYSSNATATLNPQTNGATQYIYLWFKDGAGNISANLSPKVKTIVYSNVTPTGTLTRTSLSPTQAGTTVTFNWSATSYGGANVAKVELANSLSPIAWYTIPGSSNGTPTVSGSGLSWDITNAAYSGSTANGTRYVYMRITDTALPPLVSTYSASVIYDNTAPVISGLTITGNNGTGGSLATKQTNVKVSFNLTDNLTATGSVQYQTSSTSGFAVDGTGTNGAWVTASGSSVTVTYAVASGDGAKNIFVRARDVVAAGTANVTTTQSSSIVLDTVAPNISTFNLNSNATLTNNNYVNLTIAATDANSGLGLQMQFANDAATYSTLQAYGASYAGWNVTSGYGATAGDGTKTVTIKVTDAAGNSSTLGDAISLDMTAPSPGALVLPAAVQTTRTVMATVNPTDSGSGLYQMQFYVGGYYSGWMPYAPTQLITLTPMNGSKLVYVQFMDNAGNVSSWISSTVTVTQLWSNFSRAELAAGTFGLVTEDTSYITTAGNITLDGVAGHTGTYCIVYKTSSGRIGFFDYYLTGTTTINVYYATFDQTVSPAGTTMKGGQTININSSGWSNTGSIVLPLDGNYVYVDFDNTSASSPNFTTTYSANADGYIQNNGGTLYLHIYSPASFIRY